MLSKKAIEQIYKMVEELEAKSTKSLGTKYDTAEDLPTTEDVSKALKQGDGYMSITLSDVLDSNQIDFHDTTYDAEEIKLGDDEVHLENYAEDNEIDLDSLDDQELEELKNKKVWVVTSADQTSGEDTLYFDSKEESMGELMDNIERDIDDIAMSM